ncbi:hypothetical protein [Burkholderia latens]|uniref:Uncharacterized protein n=1 Tax=Burkholderia latens TaxID=488446 RepID=A0A6H9TC63_9BURK|nr:hypothetical protein [Burkholderia latens]KAB0642207.1 hypothetical protein F7R21_13135 [Burkholderia latens]VWC03790.1 hypothetical protein BLA24064_04955 [Burkholderia latens]
MQSFCDYYGIDPDAFEASGALDPVFGVDTRLFIDPCLLKHTDTEELASSYDRVSQHFADVLKVVSNIGVEGDVFWRTADQRLTFPEVHGLCIGYATNGKTGSGMGPGLRKPLLQTVKKIIDAGVKDPALFELVGAFEDNIGPDRISDMVARIILEDLVKFTQRVCSDFGIPMEPLVVSKGLPKEDMPLNPVTGNAVILVPRDILRDLPIAETYGDISRIAYENKLLRDELNAIIGDSWRKATISDQKEVLRNSFIKHPDILLDVLSAYHKAGRSLYDFKDDPAGETRWYRASKEFSAAYPLELTLEAPADTERVFAVVKKICQHFRELIEDNQLCKLLYNKGGTRKHESAAQLIFFGIASAYCRANGLELSPESDGGRGPVDFKLSSGFDGRVLVEVKLSSNSQLFHGFEKQLPIYQKAERATKGVYLVIDNGGASEDRMAAFRNLVLSAGKDAPEVIIVDGVPRPSASKADK